MSTTKSRIAIIGTGLIGTSIGLNLTARKDRTYEVVGADRDRSHARHAKKMGAIDREVDSLEEAVENAGLVVIAVPVMACRLILQQLGKVIQPGSIVIDVCSTKADVMRWAEEYLPERVHFVGTHPMAGKESSGPADAHHDLFHGAGWAVMPSSSADSEAVSIVLGVIEAMGAEAIWIDAAEHDQFAAAVSHVPLIISVALFRMVRDSAGWEDASLLASTGFKDLTRLASGDPTMAKDIMTTNREAVVHWIGRLQQELATIRQAVELGGQPLKDLFASTQLDRDTYLANPPVRRMPAGVTPPSAQDAMGQLFVGGLYNKLKEMPARVAIAQKDDAALRKKLGIPDEPDDEEL